MLVDVSASLLLTITLDDESGRLKMGFKRDGRSNCRDSSCSEEVLEDVVEDEDVGAAGTVELVTICRLTCRGK